MRDASMVTDVAVGDRVRIKLGVVLDGRDWSGLEGSVVYVWEKCEVRERPQHLKNGTIASRSRIGANPSSLSTTHHPHR